MLDTIRCPKMLILLNRQLPECKSAKKLMTLKDIDKEEEEDEEKPVYPRSMKKIASQKQILSPVLEKMKPVVDKILNKENEKINENFKVLISLSRHLCRAPTGMLNCPELSPTRTLFADLYIPLYFDFNSFKTES